MGLVFTGENQPQARGKLVGRIGYRPNTYIWIVLIFGICLAILIRSLIGYLLGGFMILMALLYLFKVKEKPVMDVYEKDLVIYDPEDSSRTAVVSCEDVSEFYTGDAKTLNIQFRLNDGNPFSISTAQTSRAYSLLEKVLSGKGTGEKNLEHKRMKLF